MEKQNNPNEKKTKEEQTEKKTKHGENQMKKGKTMKRDTNKPRIDHCHVSVYCARLIPFSSNKRIFTFSP